MIGVAAVAFNNLKLIMQEKAKKDAEAVQEERFDKIP